MPPAETHDPPNLGQIHRHAIEIADHSRALVERMLTADLEARLKADQSFVTDLDLAIEDQARERLAAWYPKSQILGEERSFGTDSTTADDELSWIIDPIDGTHSLRQRLPLFGTVLACLHRGVPVVGLIDLHALDQRYCAVRGRGTTRNGDPVRITESSSVADRPPIESEIIALGDRRQFIASGLLAAFDSLLASGPVVRIYPDCFGHGLVVSGAAGAMLDPDLKPWDLAATRILVEEAGGSYVEFDRHPGTPERFDVLFGKPSVVSWIQNHLDGLS